MWLKRVMNFILLNIVFISSVSSSFQRRPNIVIFLADDLGRNDVSLHGSSQIPTPNIDALGYNGVILNRHYTMHVCTPSRAALLTGKYPIRSGLQSYPPILAGQPRALPVNMATIGEKLIKLGYNTHLIGKWHLGHQNRSVLPTGRGFQTHLGYWSGMIGYFDYQVKERVFGGFDLHRDTTPAFQYNGTYATDLFTEEAINLILHHNPCHPMFMLVSHLAAHTSYNDDLQVPDPEEANKKYSYIKEPKRRLYADIVNRLDTSVGRVVKALSQKRMLDNTILLFMSDNGAQTAGYHGNFGSNWPLRGLKVTLFEGGIRNVAVMWSKLLRKRHYIENTVFHITDWLPTLYAAAGGNLIDLGKIDGVNKWPLLSQGKNLSRRKDILLNIDEVNNYSGILSSDGRYKLTQGSFQNGIFDGYFGDSGRSNSTPKYNINSVLDSDVNRAILRAGIWSPLTAKIIKRLRNNLVVKQLNAKRDNLTCNYCLFDLWNDPTETTDISSCKPEVVKQLNASLEAYRTEIVSQANITVDPNSNPALCGGTWFTWLDPMLKCTLQNAPH